MLPARSALAEPTSTTERLVGRLAALLDPDRLSESLDAVLEVLCEELGAQAAELLLADPAGSEVILHSIVAPDSGPFVERTRFSRGEGFPGTVLAGGAAVSSPALRADPRLLRTAIARDGYQAFVSSPIRLGEHLHGCVDLAWRRSPDGLDRVANVLACAGVPISVAIRATHAEARSRVHGGTGLSRHLTELLRADGVSAMRVESATLRVLDVDVTGRPAGAARLPRLLGRRLGDCPALVDGRPKVHPLDCGGRLECGARNHLTCCVPTRFGDDLGLVVATFDSTPNPATRQLDRLLNAVDALDVRGSTETSANRTPRLALTCFGPLEVRIDGHLVPSAAFRRKKTRELLALLVSRSGCAVSADTIVEHLWPGLGVASGMSRLHVVLHDLRKILEPGGKPWVHLRRVHDAYLIDPASSVSCDLWRFEALRRRAHKAKDPELAIPLLEDAIALVAGPLFGGEFDGEWCLEDRYAVETALLGALERLASEYLARGDLGRARETLRRVNTESLRLSGSSTTSSERDRPGSAPRTTRARTRASLPGSAPRTPSG